MTSPQRRPASIAREYNITVIALTLLFLGGSIVALIYLPSYASSGRSKLVTIVLFVSAALGLIGLIAAVMRLASADGEQSIIVSDNLEEEQDLTVKAGGRKPPVKRPRVPYWKTKGFVSLLGVALAPLITATTAILTLYHTAPVAATNYDCLAQRGSFDAQVRDLGSIVAQAVPSTAPLEKQCAMNAYISAFAKYVPVSTSVATSVVVKVSTTVVVVTTNK